MWAGSVPSSPEPQNDERLRLCVVFTLKARPWLLAFFGLALSANSDWLSYDDEKLVS
jgi:hypothetical protein